MKHINTPTQPYKTQKPPTYKR